MKTAGLTLFALIAFAANSVLCRLALGQSTIDPASFTVVRLLAGMVVLMLIVQIMPSNATATKGSWLSAAMLFVYAITFSYAYTTLDTGTGALVLFGAVQVTMILSARFSGARLRNIEWIGLGIAFCGLVYLVLPNVSSPSITGFLLMTSAGIAWGIYTLRGKGSGFPLSDTAFNFLRTAPFVAVVAALTLPSMQASHEGVMLAVSSGAVASGIGYAVWYTALPHLSATEAAVVQLSVPMIAAGGGLLFVDEAITLRLMVASALVLGGILMVILGRRYFTGA